MNLVVPVVFLRNPEQKVLERCEDVGKEYQEETLIRKCPAQSTETNENSENYKQKYRPVQEKLDYR